LTKLYLRLRKLRLRRLEPGICGNTPLCEIGGALKLGICEIVRRLRPVQSKLKVDPVELRYDVAIADPVA
jgi:hypothetical protein